MSKIISSRNPKNIKDYKIVRKFIAGLVLSGNEIKSIRNNSCSIDQAYVIEKKDEIYLNKLKISNYKYAFKKDKSEFFSGENSWKLLLKRKEIEEIKFLIKAKNLIAIPISLFINERNLAKIEIALAQKLRKYQIKKELKERELKRELQKNKY